MTVLNKLAIGTSADGAEGTGTGSNGNDQQLKALLLAIANHNKRSPHSIFVESAMVWEFTNASTSTAIHRSFTQKMEVGTRLLGVVIDLTESINTSTNADNFVTISMYKTTALSTSEPKDVNGVQGTVTEVYLIPEQNIRSIKGVDDGNSIQLPVQMDYVAADEYVTFRMSAISTSALGGTAVGWFGTTVNFWYSSEHVT